MSVLQQLKSALPIEDDSDGVYEYECHDCGHSFRTKKDPGRAICEECRSTDLEELE